MSNPLMEKMLDLPEFEVTDFKQNDNDMGFYVETKKRPTFCPVCGCYMPNLVIYKSRKQTVRDISVLGKRTALIIVNFELIPGIIISDTFIYAAIKLPSEYFFVRNSHK